MKNYILCLIWLFLNSLPSCDSNGKQQFKIQDNYTATSNEDLQIHFLKSADSVFLTYFFIYDKGNFLNTPIDSTDYAGYFLRKDVKKNKVVFSIKDYREFWRDSSKIYNLNLTFLTDSTLEWYIDSSQYGLLDYVPNKMIFAFKNK